VYPGLALANALRERGHRVSFLGTKGGLERRLVSDAGFDFREIGARPFVRGLSVAALRAPAAAVASVKHARPVVREADVVVGLGGYVSVPAVLAARKDGVPSVLHEQNAVPGLANRRLAWMSGAVGLSFAEAGHFFPRRTRLVLTGNPVREEILRVRTERDALAKEARIELMLDDARRTVLIFGGSQGALHIDRAAVGACRLLSARSDLQVVLITGPAHLGRVREGLPSKSGLLIRPFAYLERMELAYACADLIVARAGATTIAEVTACGLPALLVPYPYATRRHQEANARALQRTGGASILLDEQLSPQTLAERIDGLTGDGERLTLMGERSSAFGHPDAAARVADLVEGVGTRR